MARRIIRGFLVAACVGALLGTGGWYAGRAWVLRWASTPRTLAAPVEVTLERGTRLTAFSEALALSGLVSDPRLFSVWVRLFADYSRFQAGRYRFEGATTPAEVAAKILAGETWNPIVFQLTVPEGATIQLLTPRIVAGGIASRGEIERASRDRALLTTLKVPSPSLEGFLYPATYSFTAPPTLEDLLTVMVTQFWKVLPADYEQRVGALGLTLSEAVTFASLIELETARDEERGLIAEVIWNRLRGRIPLGIDAAIIYGIPDYRGDLTWQHLRDTDNPYNTRLRAGLPPTPIGSPSLKSLLAVLNPTGTGHLYYVVDGDNPGAHRFAHTINEHNKNVRDYLKGLRGRRLGGTAGEGSVPKPTPG